MAMALRGKSWMSLILAAVIALSGAIFAAPSASAASSTPFGDVAAGHWAEKHIAKLALQGLIKGNNGLFKPNDSLTRQEAVVMALRFMGVEDNVDTTDVVAFPSNFSVDNYFKPYINYAFKLKLLNMTEEFALADSEPTKAWGSSPATREWVARLLVRAIGKEEDATAANGQATSFADNASIDESLVGYINVAVRLGLVNGVSANKFDPKGNLTRAAAATLFSRAESQVQAAYSGQVTGIWLSVTPNSLTMLHSDGTTSTYAVGENTLFSRADSEKLLTIDALKVYGKALLISGGNGQADYVEQLDDTAQVKTVEGKLVVVNSAKQEINLLAGSDVAQYKYDASNPPVVTDAENQTVSLSDIPANADVQLVVDAFTSSSKVLAVVLKTSTVTKSGSGTVVAVDAAANTVQIKDASTSVSETRTVTDTATIQRDGIYVKLSGLKVGDVVDYDVVNGAVTNISVTKSATSTTVVGYIFKVDSSEQTIQYTTTKDSNDIRVKLYADNVAVTIPNVSDASLDDLFKDDEVTMTLDADGKVAAVEVGTRSIVTMTGGLISYYDADNDYIVVKDPNGKLATFTLEDNTKYDQNGTTITAASAQYLFVKGRKVNIGYADSKLAYVSFISKYAGTVVKNDTVVHTMQLKLDDGSVVTVGYGSPVVELYGNTSATYSNISAGDSVIVNLTASQDTITSILVRKTAQFDILAANASQRKLSVTDSAGTTTEWTIDSSVAIQGVDGQAASLDTFAAGNALNATFEGKTLKSIRFVPVTFGKVTSVDATTGTLTVQSGASATAAVSVGTSPIIRKNGSTLSSLTSLATGDRVEVRKNEAGSTVVTVVAGVQKTVWYADATNLLLNFKKSTLGSEDNVRVSSVAYIHQGDTSLSLGSLGNGDSVTVYVLRNKAVEIVKA